ncbi:MAG: flagellar basal-body MS-ring/collar protein FliF [Desulfovibrionaceae bacterium]
METILKRLQSYWHILTISQRTIMGVLVAVVIAIFIAMLFWMNKETYQTLYTNLNPEESNKITRYFTDNNIPYKLDSSGQKISVPQNILPKVKVQIAGEPTLTNTGSGFELFDDIKVGQTDFVQRINYQRALQGELSRSIMEFPSVEKARVHLVLPSRSLFMEENQEPSASVVLTLFSSASLNTKETQTIVNLLSMSVEGLKPERISIVDTMGKTLFSPADDDSLQGMSTSQFEYKVRLQQDFEKRIEQLLIPIFGANKSIAKVNAELDFSQRTIRKEAFDPSTTAIRSEQITEDSQKGTSQLGLNNPDPNIRADNSDGTSAQESTRSNRIINYEIGKEEQNIITSVGNIERLSIAVVVDGTYSKAEEATENTFSPRSSEELEQIKNLIASAVGYNSARGDIIEVTSAAFGEDSIVLSESPLIALGDQIGSISKLLLNGLLVFLFLIFIVRPLVLAFIRPKIEAESVESLHPLLLAEDDILSQIDPIEAVRHMEDIRSHTQQLSEDNMDQVVIILRGWLQNNEHENKRKAA